ncbi:MAG TPA: HD domain-containing phosphohydrolase [Gemmatimonadota bacterium]|nr:HD domain-containing phosphohydrolase [Gemmatimonadota bacterium]
MVDSTSTNGKGTGRTNGREPASAARGRPLPPGRLTGARIVIVDDERENLDLLTDILEREGYTNLRAVPDPLEALEMCRAEPPDLLVLDLLMPELDGLGLMDALAEDLEDFQLRPTLVVTSDHGREAKRRALSRGARDFLTKPFSPSEIRLRVANLLETRFLYLELQRHNERLEESVRERTADLEEARLEILERLALAAEWRDDDTGEHTRRVGRLAADLARTIGLSEEETRLVRRAAPLHDVGKIGIHDSILLKPGPLDEEEFDIMKTHTTIGAEILSGSRFPSLRAAEEIALSHHEKWDGSGYPRGLVRAAIPLRARIVALADVFDSLTHRRVYKEAWTAREAIDYIEDGARTQFDPDLVDAFLSLERGGRAAVALTT